MLTYALSKVVSVLLHFLLDSVGCLEVFLVKKLNLFELLTKKYGGRLTGIYTICFVVVQSMGTSPVRRL
jgi:hypothetical protein